MKLPVDHEYKDNRLTAVTDRTDGFELRADSMGFFLLKSYDDQPPHGVVPQPGDIWRTYGRGLGSIVRGCAFFNEREGWRVAYYRTADEQAEHDRRMAEQMQADRRAKFEEQREVLDAEYDALPDVFRRRIDRFRANNPDFRWEYEGYELFCCTEAVKIAEALKTPEAVREWAKLPYEEQKAAVPIGDGHSGNTFGCATHLAYLYLAETDLVAKQHGALSPLVGSKEYGDLTPEEAANA